jgi:hypothetical protein
MRLLENDHVILDRHGGQLVLAGVTDLSASHAGFPVPDLAAALKGAPKDAPIILLAISLEKRGDPHRSAWRCSCPGTLMAGW